MSVILTACRQSKQKAIARALKKKAEKKKEKQLAASAYLASAQESDFGGEESLKIWTFLLNGEKTSIVLRLETLEVACNGTTVNTIENLCDCYLTIDFPLGERKGRISTAIEDDDTSAITLTIDGTLVPDSPQ